MESRQIARVPGHNFSIFFLFLVLFKRLESGSSSIKIQSIEHRIFMVLYSYQLVGVPLPVDIVLVGDRLQEDGVGGGRPRPLREHQGHPGVYTAG